ncbi:right-handed parallel beta-helix repeat-containing protein [Noviherbaspirillum massiliense]|uniref:right-handed parallel beta-helix repeat-containing protein n=1 Tax=Noviherbaspirillum massiliense TaxID=1465823 RepID=UPI0002E6A372|nr:right-handed parallel beta-helix repeat-containing protein [Noviherbaspirillum massiliense]
MPANVASGSTLELQCGRIYVGTLDLAGKSDVTVKTAGGCGKAVLTPGQAVTGWTREQGNIYSALIAFDAAQVLIDGQPIALAHWPSRAQTWAKASSSTANSLSYAMPNADLAGATLVFRAYDWSIDARRITAYSNGTMSLATTGNPAYDGYAPSGAASFYVEGKLWMLDEPGEWAVSGGRLYVWTPDGQSPEGRAWASPNQNGIEASNSRNITVDGVRVFGAANGINAPGATGLAVSNAEIINASENGILNSGGSGLSVKDSSLRNVRHDAIMVRWGGGGELIRNSSIDAAGSIGMPTNAHAAIYLASSSGAQILNNSVTNSGYIGIRFFRNATVTGNTVDTACLVLTDCGGFYANADDKQPLNSRVEANIIRNVGGTQRLAWGIFLDGSANAVTVASNTISGNANGMMIFNSFGNTVTGNAFSQSHQTHVEIGETGDGSNVRNIVVSGNRFSARIGEETYRIGSTLNPAAAAQFGTYSGNDYASSSSVFANYNGEALSFEQWKARTGQDQSSTFKTQ